MISSDSHDGEKDDTQVRSVIMVPPSEAVVTDPQVVPLPEAIHRDYGGVVLRADVPKEKTSTEVPLGRFAFKFGLGICQKGALHPSSRGEKASIGGPGPTMREVWEGRVCPK